ncbi:MAG: HAMP domain-containing histidine kinase [Alphaproteobacteria bacterium]|nr:HAMP domain-containing histidine kinase [Alphaproteobacteria bacterium]MBR1756337.1 HAMP domain-containing histidine kinase [Alphaproteobacteria bacterium]
MIDKIKRILIIKYTIIIAFILLSGFVASYLTYRHNVVTFQEENLSDYLFDEAWDAHDLISHNKPLPRIHKITLDNKRLYNFTYWFIDGEMVYAEVPLDAVLAGRLLARLRSGNFKENIFYHVKLRGENKKSYFLMMKKDMLLPNGRKAEIFALSNYVPIRKSTRKYVRVAIYAMVIVVILSYLLGSFLAARSMKYIKNTFEKQKRFVSDATHELRTPLSIMLSYTELLEYKPDNPKVRQNLKDEIMHMNGLIDNLLTIARYDNQRVKLNQSEFDLSDMFQKTVEQISELAPSADIHLQLPRKKIKVTADKGMIQQLVYIFLDNALKYTGEDKKITLRAKVDNAKVKIEIEDNGQGLSEEEQKYIFDRFWRADASRHQKGLGLGLSIALEIVKLHKGKIKVSSEQGKGSIFTVTLPIVLP